MRTLNQLRMLWRTVLVVGMSLTAALAVSSAPASAADTGEKPSGKKLFLTSKDGVSKAMADARTQLAAQPNASATICLIDFRTPIIFTAPNVLTVPYAATCLDARTGAEANDVVALVLVTSITRDGFFFAQRGCPAPPRGGGVVEPDVDCTLSLPVQSVPGTFRGRLDAGVQLTDGTQDFITLFTPNSVVLFV